MPVSPSKRWYFWRNKNSKRTKPGINCQIGVDRWLITCLSGWKHGESFYCDPFCKQTAVESGRFSRHHFYTFMLVIYHNGCQHRLYSHVADYCGILHYPRQAPAFFSLLAEGSRDVHRPPKLVFHIFTHCTVSQQLSPCTLSWLVNIITLRKDQRD